MDPVLTSSKRAIASFGRADLESRQPLVHLLRNGSMVTRIAAAGGGYTHYVGKALTRWQLDQTRDADGYFVYVRDLESGEYWSATYQPTLAEPDDYQVQFYPHSACFARRDGEIVTEQQVCLATDANVELRRIKITNLGIKSRQIELTSYSEVVLHDPQADSAHPAYSKLFVETWQGDSGALFARRRPRQAGESTICACHFVVGPDVVGPAVIGPDRGEPTTFETDRSRFLGRGNTAANPAALQSKAGLSGTTGSVLDPIFSHRRVLHLSANESVTVTFALAAGDSSEELESLVSQFATAQSVDEAMDELDLSSGVKSSDSNGAPQNHLANDNDHLANGDSLPAAAKSEQTHRPASCHGPTASRFNEPLQHDNGWGGFSADGTEYVIRLRPTADASQQLPPMPWVNIIANENTGFIASETGAGCTWSGNSRLNRLTPWHNDPISDSHGEAIYVRDDDSQTFWSLTPGPIRQPTVYEVRHGFGYTRFLHTSNEFEQELVQFVPREDAIKIAWVRLHNTSDRARRISLFSYHQWDLCDGNATTQEHTETAIDAEQRAVFATNDQRGVFADNCSFAKLVPPAGADSVQSTCDRFEFLGPHGNLTNPKALADNVSLTGKAGKGLDPCAASQTSIEIGPGESVEFAVLLGEAPSQAAASELLQRYNSPVSWAEALSEVESFWRHKLAAVQIKTPSAAVDLMVNGWLPYQNLSCRMWGRTSLFQSGGAYGYRDQLQDAAALLHHWPELTKQQIVRNAAHQFSEGDVLHWWHPPQSVGIRTMFSDDLLWLPLFAAEYVEATGDASLWQESIRFLAGDPLPAGEAEIMLTPNAADESGTLYEHCCRALDRGLTSGRHGLPLMGSGDWNDGMNCVGKGGTGESVWLGFFIDYILGKMLPVCEQFDDQERLERYLGYREQLRNALHESGWDGGWYRRAYFDDGTPLGTAAADECQIDALVQAWAVLSGADTPERANKAMAAASDRLIDKEAGLIQLLDPPFDRMSNDPGYIKGYVPGVRENGGQYTHGVLWFIRAVAELGQGSRAVELLEMLSPINHARNLDEVNTYKTEPYVVAADVYSQSPHSGRGGWSWYTGSAGWMWRVAVESILGIRLVGGDTLRIDPRISADWPECCVHYRLDDEQTVYEIIIRNPSGLEQGVQSSELDGVALDVVDAVALVPLTRDGATHRVVVTL